MALAGCDFYCVNSECKCFSDGSKYILSISGAWPMGNINDVLDTIKDEGIRQNIIDRKEQDGRKYWPITMPNANNVKIVAYRVEKWCPNCFCLWREDVELNGLDLSEALKNYKGKENCSKCNTILWKFEDIIKKGINCKFCNKLLNQRRWFVNE